MSQSRRLSPSERMRAGQWGTYHLGMRLIGTVRSAPEAEPTRIEVEAATYPAGLEQLEQLVPAGHQLIAIRVDRDDDPRAS